MRNRVALKGPLTTPVGGGFTSVNVGLRRRWNSSPTCVRCGTFPGVPSRYQGVDLVIVRENTEDLYSGLEHEVVPGVVESLKIITSDASTRIAEFAFQYAKRHGRKRITAVHKANIMKMGDGLFLRCVQDVAAGYPGITQDDRIVDAACMHLVMRPEQFDVLLLPNLYGDIVSDLCAGLVGGPRRRAGSQPRRRDRRLRSGAWQRPRYRGPQHRQSNGAVALGIADAAAHRRSANGGPDHEGAR
jgi:isocitrate dehydrogenase (NAD+)